MEYTLRISGQPFGKQRPQHGKGFTYTPVKTRDYEKLVRSTWRSKNAPMLMGYINIYIDAYYRIADSDPEWKKQAKRYGILRPGKPDADNVEKVIMDALNKTAYPDDSMVELVLVEKQYSDDPHVDIRIISTDPVEDRVREFRRAYDRKRNP